MTDEPLGPPDSFSVSEQLIPGWWTWRSPINRQWHARRRGTDSPVQLHSDDFEDLVEKCKEYDMEMAS
jgi:hypothetical protein